MRMMNLFFMVIIGVFFTITPNLSFSQYNVVASKDKVNSRADTIGVSLPSFLTIDTKNQAYYNFMKKKRRLERNFFETTNTFNVTQYAYDNWVGGGENSFNGKISTQTQYVYHNEKVAFDTYINASFGLSTSDGKLRKLEDYFQLNSDVSYRIYRKWNYTFGFNLASQFTPTKTYDSDGNVTGYKTAFFAPATLKPYFGITYKVTDNQKITFAPISGNIVMVLDEKLSNKGIAGVEAGKKSKLSVGAYINAQWTQNITKNGMLKYRTIIQSFWDYKTTPNLNFENWLDFNILRYFSVNLYFRMIYDEKVKTVEDNNFLQIKQSLGFGMIYKFKNKSKPTYNIIK